MSRKGKKGSQQQQLEPPSYSMRPGRRGVSAEAVAEELLRLEKVARRRGRKLTPEDVVEAARDPESPLHAYFVWDDETAAAAYRLDQARQMIYSIRIRRQETGGGPLVVRPLFLSAQDQDAPGYRSLDNAFEDEAEGERIVAANIAVLDGWWRRCEVIAKLAGVAGGVRDLLTAYRLSEQTQP